MLVIIFTRYPTPGAVKTRLIPAVGAAGAASVHRQMTEHTLDRARELRERMPVSIAVHFDGSDSQAERLLVQSGVVRKASAFAEVRQRQQMVAWLGTDLVYQSQGEGDLGVRMNRSIESACQQGCERAVLIGTDCPELTADVLAQAFEHLLERDLVLGAALDGGYYLIGMCHPQPELFVGVDWGTDRVWQQTIAIANRLNLSIGYLPKLADIDRPEDLSLLRKMNRWDANIADL